jgi:hypothetical protein
MEIIPFSQNEQYMHNALLGSSHAIVCVPIPTYAFSNLALLVISKHNNISSY